MYGYIYLTRNLINNKKYIGQRKGEFDKNYLGSGKWLKKAIKKYGKENFCVDILYVCKTKEETDEKEILAIKDADACKSREFYNIVMGGINGLTMWDVIVKGSSEDFTYREKLSKANKGRIHEKVECPHCGKIGGVTSMRQWHFDNCWKTEQGQQYRKKISGLLKGKKRSEKSKKKMSESHKGKKLSIETKQKMSIARSGIKFTAEHKQNISKGNKGQKHEKIKCPHCDKIGGIRSMRRWHFDNCVKTTQGQLLREKQKVKCPHCGLIGFGGNMTRYHFDNCKQKKEVE